MLAVFEISQTLLLFNPSDMAKHCRFRESTPWNDYDSLSMPKLLFCLRGRFKNVFFCLFSATKLEKEYTRLNCSFMSKILCLLPNVPQKYFWYFDMNIGTWNPAILSNLVHMLVRFSTKTNC